MSDECKGGCRGKGMCPGVALLAAGIPAMLLYKLTGQVWLFLATLTLLVPIFTLGLHKSIRISKTKTDLPSNES